jgi:hypothetical protein
MPLENFAQRIIGYFDLNERTARGMAEACKRCHDIGPVDGYKNNSSNESKQPDRL